MEKQYSAQYMQVQDTVEEGGSGKWRNAFLSMGGKRYFSTKTEARAALEQVRQLFSIGNGLGCDVVVDAETARMEKVIKTRIRVRQVAKWETVEEWNE